MIELVVVQCDHYGVVCVVDIVEDASSALVKSSSGNDSGDLGARHTDAVPPTTDCFPVYHGAGDVQEGDFDAALQRPEPVHSLDFKDCVPVGNRDLDQ